MTLRKKIFSLALLTPLFGLVSCTAPVNSTSAPQTHTSDTSAFDPGATCLLLDTHPNFDFRIQCTAYATFYLSFKAQGQDGKVDLKDKTFKVELSSGDMRYQLDDTLSELEKFRHYETGDKVMDSKTLWVTLNMQALTSPIQMTAEVEGYAPITQQIDVTETQEKNGIPELLIELTPIQ